ncbi:MAG: S8 family serine peptidase [Pseudoxanthomonas sp.]|nr:S8 family serine peptidase [Pseudoxanthomonas sp.]
MSLRFRAACAAAMLLVLSSAFADERCTLGFDAGSFDACAQRAALFDHALAALPGEARGARHSWWVVKFPGPIGATERAALQAIGAEAVDYLPHHALRVRMALDADPAGRVAGALWTGPMAAAWKLSGGLPELLEGGERPAALPLSVGLHPGADAADLLARWLDIDGVVHGFEVEGTSSPRVVLSLVGARLEGVLAAIAPQAEVASIGLRKQMAFLNARAGWLHQSGSPGQLPVFDRGLLGCGQVVGVLDSGVDFNHCAFNDTVHGDPPISDCGDGAACAPGLPDLLQRKTLHYYKWSGAGDALGDNACSSSTGAGHGTHVAGSITGSDPANPVDCAAGTLAATPGNLDGTAPGARLVAQEMGESLQYVNNLGGSIYHAATVAHANGARIHSNSWGGSCCFLGLFCLPGCTASYDEFARDADQATWDFPELLVAIAAGNNGTCCASSGGAVGSPGLAKSALTVGASGAGASGANAASFSSRGPTLDRRTKPDVMAQGDGIVSTASDGSTSTGGCATCTFSGTSMATPTAAGLAALVREYLNRGFYPGGSENAADAIAEPSAALLKALLVNGARDMTGTGAAAAAPNQVEGWGRIHLDDVLHFSGDARRLWLHDAAAGLATGEQAGFALEVGAGQPLKVTLVWSDFPAAIGANPHVVNRLRLEVEDPDGGVWTQKLPATGTPNPTQSTADTGHDDRNVVHQLLFPTPAAGTWQVRVRGINVPMGDGGQRYAVVATGDVAAPAGGSSADLALAIVPGAAPVEPGGLARWLASVDNLGPDAAGIVAVTATLPVPATEALAPPGWQCEIVVATVICTFDGGFPAGGSAGLQFHATAPDSPGVLTALAGVSSDVADPDPANNTGSADVLVGARDLALAKSASTATVEAGRPFDWLLAVAMDAPGAVDVVVADPLPAGTCVLAIDAPGWTCGLDADTVECAQAGPLAVPPAPVRLTVLAPDKGGELANTATVQAANPDPAPADNSAQASVTVTGAPEDRVFRDDFEAKPACLD